MLGYFIYTCMFLLAWVLILLLTEHYFWGYRIGILWQPGGVWVGVHYSPFCQRYCINLIPCVTLWVAKPGGKIPYSTR